MSRLVRKARCALEVVRDPVSGVQVHVGRLRSGPRIALVPMPGFRSVECAIAVPYGALEQRLGRRRIPAGVAHFLEHLMFQTPQGDAFEHFAQRGASANAWTSHDHTAYIVSCASDLTGSLELLIGMLGSFTLPSGRVELERDIILQEMAIYDDDPGWRGQGGLLARMYPRHPLRDDIVGTRQSVEQIDEALLRAAFDAWYAPADWHIALAGPFDPREVADWLDGRIDRHTRSRGGPRSPRARAVVARPGSRRIAMGLAHTHHLTGLPITPLGTRPARRRQRVVLRAALDLLFDDGGRVQDELYSAGLVDEQLGAWFDNDQDYAHGVISAVVDDPRAYVRVLEAAWTRAMQVRPRVSTEESTRARNALQGSHLRRFGSVESTCAWALDSLLDARPFDDLATQLEHLDAPLLGRAMKQLHAAPRIRIVLR